MNALPDKSAGDSAEHAVPDDAQQLRDEIERTREHLGDTVDLLASKLDVKSRARTEAAEVAGQVKSAAAQVPDQVKSATARLPDQLRSAAARARRQTGASAGKARGLLSGTGAGAHAANGPGPAALAGPAGKAKPRRAAPDSVRQTITKGASAARENPVTLAAVIAGLAAAFLTLWRRRKR